MGKQDGRDRTVSDADIDDAGASILHADLDAFFASVELLDHPELRGKPVIVGHEFGRGVVTAATYEARAFGVNSAMPMALALRRCPHAVILRPHYERYQHYSEVFFDLCHELTPIVEKVGIDEGFLDVAGAGRAVGSPKQAAQQLRRRMREKTGLIVSVGAAATKYVAKVASGRAKPDGLLVVPPSRTVEFLHPLPVSALWGVGAKTEERLRSRGYTTVGDIARADATSLRRAVGDAATTKLQQLAWGVDPRAVTPGHEEKSIGHEVTFGHDVADPVALRRELLRLSDDVAVRLRRAGVTARTIALKLRYDDFDTISRSRTIAAPTDLAKVIYDEAVALLDTLEPLRAPIRLIGVRGEQLSRETAAAPLWEDAPGWREAESVMDAARARFGRGAVKPATLLGHDPGERPKLTQRD